MDKSDGVLLDVDGNVVEGLPASYDNIDEQGNVLYLDEERLLRKERPDKPLWKNAKRGLGIKDFIVTHTSARQWNWGVVLKVFKNIVSLSPVLQKPQSLGAKLYRRAMLFDPPENSYSAGFAFNLLVDVDENTAANQEKALFDGARGESGGGFGGLQSHVKPRLHEAVSESMECDGSHGGSAREPMPSDLRSHAAGHSRTCECAECQGVARGSAKRVTIPIGETIPADSMKRVTVPMDLVKRAIAEAKYIGGMKECLCRAGNDCKDYPHDLACLFLNMGGKVVVDHGMAVELTVEEAFARVDRAAELGLACQSLWVQVEQLIWGFENGQMDTFLEICFCCPCCCVGLNLSKNALPDIKEGFHPSGWTAVVNHDACVGCKHCLDDYCPQDAIHYRASDGKMVVDQDRCIGCGYCRARCPEGAIKIKQTMPMREGVLDYFEKEARLAIRPGEEFEGRPSLMPLDGIARKIAEDDAQHSRAR